MDIEKTSIQAMFYDYPIEVIVKNLIVSDRGGDSLWYYDALKRTLHDRYASLNMGEVEAISRLIEEKWIGNAIPRQFSTPLDGAFKVILHCVNIFLKESKGELIVSFDNLLRWNSITRLIGEDWMTCVYMAYHRHHGLETFAWPDILSSNGEIIDSISKTGLCDIHTHWGGAGDPFILNWIGLMNGKFIDDKTFEKIGGLRIWSPMAARIRYALYSYYIDGNTNAFGPQMNCDMKGLAGLEKDFLTSRNWTLTLISNAKRTAKETAEGLKVDYAIRNDFNDNEQHSPYMLYHGERRLLYMFLCDYKTGSKAVRKIARYVYLYAIIKIAFRRQLVIDHAHRGLHYFRDFNHNKTLFIPTELDGIAKRFAYQTSIRPQANDSLELRINATKKELEMAVGNYCNHSIFGDKKWLKEEESDRVNYVVHFSKPGMEEVGDNEMRILVDDLLENYFRRGCKLTGIDAAGEELQCRPEQLGHCYRYLKERGHKNFTFHVGEDFYDIVDGLRAIDETIVFLGVEKGWRLGHCVAIGIDPYRFYERKRRMIIMPRKILLDNLVWMAMTCKEEGIRIPQALKKDMAIVIKRLMKGIFGDVRPSMQTYYHAMWLRSDIDGGDDNTAWDRTKKCHHERSIMSRESGQAVLLSHRMKYEQVLVRKGKSPENWKASEDYIRLVGKLQKVMMKRLGGLGVTIESNPTSNLMLSGLERYDELPLLRHSSMSRLGGVHLPVTINTDDKGLFGTSLLNEYALMARAMSKKEGVLTVRKWSDRRIADYLLKTVACSHKMKFLWKNNEYEIHGF